MRHRVAKCGHKFLYRDAHTDCPLCRECSEAHPCATCVQWSPRRWGVHHAALTELRRPQSLPSVAASTARDVGDSPSARTRAQIRSHGLYSDLSGTEDPTVAISTQDSVLPGGCYAVSSALSNNRSSDPIRMATPPVDTVQIATSTVDSVQMAEASVDPVRLPNASVDSVRSEGASVDRYYSSRNTRTFAVPSVFPVGSQSLGYPHTELPPVLSPVFEMDVRDRGLRRSRNELHRNRSHSPRSSGTRAFDSRELSDTAVENPVIALLRDMHSSVQLLSARLDGIQTSVHTDPHVGSRPTVRPDIPHHLVSVSDRLDPDSYAVSDSSEEDPSTVSYSELLTQVYEILGPDRCPSPPAVPSLDRPGGVWDMETTETRDTYSSLPPSPSYLAS